MPRIDQSRMRFIGLITYSAFGAILWAKFAAGRSVQEGVAGLLFVVGILFINVCCVRYLKGRTMSPISESLALVARSTNPIFLVLGMLGIAYCDVRFTLCLIGQLQGAACSVNGLGSAWLFVFIGAMFTWAGAYEFRLRKDSIDYFSFIGGYRSLSLDEINYARVRRGEFTYTDRFRPPYRLEIIAANASDLPSIIVNLRVFKKVDVDRLFNWLGEKLRRE